MNKTIRIYSKEIQEKIMKTMSRDPLSQRSVIKKNYITHYTTDLKQFSSPYCKYDMLNSNK